jgi:serine phosphatase RsbU (regulator of sigma subunit)
VPGAFMSMIGFNLLNEIVNVRGITDAANILYKLNEGVQKSLKQETSNSKDGMDMALVVIDEKKKKLQYAGAKNPLIYVKDGQLEVIKASKSPIGGLSKLQEGRDYENHEITYDKDTIFYMFTDGYQDQFGGPHDQKFMIKRLKDMLQTIHDLPVEKQKFMLEDTLDKWMAKTRQLDDILMVGFRV